MHKHARSSQSELFDDFFTNLFNAVAVIASVGGWPRASMTCERSR
jgi:hypothetical protein